MNAEKFAKIFTPIAAANNIIMVFPQAEECWDNFEGYTGLDHLERTGKHHRMMKHIVDTVTKPFTTNSLYFNYFENSYEMGTAYDPSEILQDTDFKCESWIDKKDGERHGDCYKIK